MDAGNKRAAAAGLSRLKFHEADACNLEHVPNESFDVTVSLKVAAPLSVIDVPAVERFGEEIPPFGTAWIRPSYPQSDPEFNSRTLVRQRLLGPLDSSYAYVLPHFVPATPNAIPLAKS